MIIDSHTHYNNNAYKKPFRYLSYDKDGYTLKEGELPQLIQAMENANIRYFIEPGVSLQSCEEVLQLCSEYPGRIFPAIGVHPTRSIFEKWSDRNKLVEYANTPGVIAIGEIGLDYHYKREEQHRLIQHIWFLYQLNLAWKMKLPVILHIRDAHEDALRILKWHPARKLGGVIHCFYGSTEIAEQYLKLGYHIGIGGSLLQVEERAKDLWEAIPHVENPDKTDEGRLITSWECNSRIADAEFLYTKQEYIRKTGRVRGADDVIAYHLRQSFLPGEITPEEANRLGRELASRFTKGDHAYIVCTHIDKAHIHNHIIWNSTNLEADRKFRNFWGSTKAIRRLSDTICIENGYSIVENPRRHGLAYNKWLGDKRKPCHRELICADIDQALAQNPESFEKLLLLLEEAGYQIKRGKVPSLHARDQKRFIRMDSLGEGYLPAALKAVIAGKQPHRPRKRIEGTRPLEEKAPASLLVDIQAKLQEGKGAGYVRWAKSFNLKQAAQTLIYLQENKLLEYVDLDKRTLTVTDRYHELSAEIKSAETRMAEIKILQQHIINYSKTRSTYVAYRKAGYSKKFKQEHEHDILLHQSAKRYFDEMGFEKLPALKSLQAEYAELLSRKKEMYPKYRKLRSEMKELLTVKANVDRLLNMDTQPEREEQRDKPR